MSLAGIILAAGASSRMGSPKALLTWQGETFLDRLIGLLARQCSPVIVVLGHQAEVIRAGLSRAGGALFVTNERYKRGQLSSLQLGLGAVPVTAEAALFMPVDCPSVQTTTVAALAAAFRKLRPLLVIPRYHGRRGHPVCVSRQLIPEFLELPPEAQARSVIRRHLEQAYYVDVDDPGVVQDIDDPESYRRLLAAAAAQ